MKVLVTGATGFLGQKLVQRLAQEEGVVVTATGRRTSVDFSYASEKVVFVQACLELREEAERVVQGHDVVFHCAALSAPWGSWRSFYNSNVKATSYLLDACEKYAVSRVVHVSTPSVYVDSQNKWGVHENTRFPKKFVNRYAASKYMAEECVRKAVARGVSVITLRPQGIIGAGDTSIMPRLLQAAQKGVFPRVGGGRTHIDLTCVDNVVDAMLLAWKAPSTLNGRVYHISNGEPVLLYPLLEEVFESLGVHVKYQKIPFRVAYLLGYLVEKWHSLFRLKKEPVLTRYSACVLGRTRTLDISRARRELGYVPQKTVAQGVHEFVQWWKQTRVV